MTDFPASEMESDMREVFDGLPQKMTLASGKEIDACVSSGAESDGLELAGVTDERQITAYFVMADCDELPAANDVVTFGGVGYRVKEFYPGDDGVSGHIVAVGEYQ